MREPCPGSVPRPGRWPCFSQGLEMKARLPGHPVWVVWTWSSFEGERRRARAVGARTIPSGPPVAPDLDVQGARRARRRSRLEHRTRARHIAFAGARLAPGRAAELVAHDAACEDRSVGGDADHG